MPEMQFRWICNSIPCFNPSKRVSFFNLPDWCRVPSVFSELHCGQANLNVTSQLSRSHPKSFAFTLHLEHAYFLKLSHTRNWKRNREQNLVTKFQITHAERDPYFITVMLIHAPCLYNFRFLKCFSSVELKTAFLTSL